MIALVMKRTTPAGPEVYLKTRAASEGRRGFMLTRVIPGESVRGMSFEELWAAAPTSMRIDEAGMLRRLESTSAGT